MSGFAHIDVGTATIIKRLPKSNRVDGGPVAGLIPGTAVVPIVQEEPPTIDYRTHRRVRAEPDVTPSAVVMGWNVEPLSADQLIANIKAEAGRVITAHVPEWKQRNLLAQSVELVNSKVAGNSGNAQAEQAMKAVWGWIEEVRTESDAKEAAVAAGDSFDLDAWPEWTL